MIKRNLSLRTKSVLFVVFCVVFAATNHKVRAEDAVVTATNQGSARPDNSGVNKRDRHNANPTPENQKGTKADLEVTKKIRRTLTSSTNHFSTTAENIKVITVNGKVTLRGPVKTEEEKTRIAAIAKEAAGDGNVEDQLEVKHSQ
jgi:hyperosmotically inducible protein